MVGIGQEYINTVLKRLKYYKDLAERTFEQLEEKDFNYQPTPGSNSVAIIIQHIAGNMLSRFTNFLTEDGEKEWRQRDEEFESHNFSKEQLINIWNKGWNCCLDAIKNLKEDELLKTIYIRKEPLTVIDAINRQLAHYPHHIGQIVFLGRMIRGNEWKTLSIAKGQSLQFNQGDHHKDPSQNFK